MARNGKTHVAVNGYGVIGKRVADGVAAQEDMELIGVADVTTDWRLKMATRRGYRLFAAAEDRAGPMREAGYEIAGTLDDLLGEAVVVVDCTPKPLGPGTPSSIAGAASGSCSRAARSTRPPATPSWPR